MRCLEVQKHISLKFFRRLALFYPRLREIPIGKLIDAHNKNPEFKIAVQLHDGRLLEQVFQAGKISIEKLT